MRHYCGRDLEDQPVTLEAAVRQLDAEQADTVRRAVNGILQQAEPPEPNITKEMQWHLKA